MSKKTVIQFLRFGVVGVINTLIHTAIYNIASNFGLHHMLCQTLGFLISSMNSFLMNYKLVFKSENVNKGMIIRFYSTYVASFLVTIVVTYVCVDVLGFYPVLNLGSFGKIELIPLLPLAFTIPMNFVLNKYWVYK